MVNTIDATLNSGLRITNDVSTSELHLQQKGIDLAVIDSAGDISIPNNLYAPNKDNLYPIGPSFLSTYDTSSGLYMSLERGAPPTKLISNLVNWNIGGYYDPINSRFTPLVEGYYQFWFNTFNGLLDNSTQSCYISLYKNGIEYKRGNHTASATFRISGTCIAYMNGTTDYAEMYGYNYLYDTTDTNITAGTITENSFGAVFLRGI